MYFIFVYFNHLLLVVLTIGIRRRINHSVN